MTRATILLLSLLLSASAAEPPLKVTVHDLLATPRTFIGKRVDVTGFYRASLEDSSLLSRAPQSKDKWSSDNAIWLEPDIWDPRHHPHRPKNVSDVDDLKDRKIRVIGTFRYKKIIPADERKHQRWVPGYGHMGGWERAIIDITYFRAVR